MWAALGVVTLTAACVAEIDGTSDYTGQGEIDLYHRHHPDARRPTTDAKTPIVDARIATPDATPSTADAHQATPDAAPAVVVDAGVTGALPLCTGPVPQPPAPVHGYFTPITTPTPMTVPVVAPRALMSCRINGAVSVIATSEYHELFIISGKLLALGCNRSGEMGLGNGAPDDFYTPQAVDVPSTTSFVAAAAGGYQSVAVDASGYVWTFGNNTYGARGNNTPATANEIASTPEDTDGVPVQLTVDSAGAAFGGPTDPIIQVSSSLRFDAALSTSGKVYAWGFTGNDAAGSDSTGIIGDGSAMATAGCATIAPTTASCSLRSPHKAKFPIGIVIKKISASSDIILALDQNGAIWSWGGNGDAYALGIGDTAATTTAPTKITQGRLIDGGALTAVPAFTMIANNLNVAYAVDASGDLWGWGYGWIALIGPGVQWNPESSPVKLTHTSTPNYAALDARLTAGRKIVDVVVSVNSTHVLLDNGELWGWGDSAMGEVGNGQVVNYLTETAGSDGHVMNDAWDWGGTTSLVHSATLILTNVASVHSSNFSFHVMAERTDGTIYSWGRNANGVLGNGLQPYDVTMPYFTPYPPVSPSSYTPNIGDVPFPTWVQPF